jgi:hypothetical protein
VCFIYLRRPGIEPVQLSVNYPMLFNNLYYKRVSAGLSSPSLQSDSPVETTATPKACFVCYKPTNTVLATINTVDFLYTCPIHLTDPNFASPLGDSGDGLGGGSRKMGLSAEEIAKVKEEWEERQKQKLEKEKAKQKEKMDEKEKTGEKEKKDNVKETESRTLTPTPPLPTHQRFTLHRDFFAMRLSEHRKRRQMVQVKELAPRLPGAPRGGLSSMP